MAAERRGWKDFGWIYGLAALLNLLAVAIRLYEWSVHRRDTNAWELLLPAVAFVILAILWQQSRRLPGDGNG
jgi:hypothetical protein